MGLRAPDGTDLDIFYAQNPCLNSPCEDSDETDWWRFSPYNWEETKYYIIKMFALPLGASIVYFLIFILSLYNNPVIHITNSILVFIGGLFLNSYRRERRRAREYEITVADGLIDVPIPYDVDQEESLFKFNLNTLSPTAPKYTIGFVGDIMMVNKHELDFDPILPFFDDVDLIVGNLEGIVRNHRNTLGKQAHQLTIFDKLKPLLRTNRQLLLCLSNNHSSDYGNKEFAASRKSNHVNIFFPHWSYENERYTRNDIQDQADTLLTGNANRWDLIFGQHSHTRQPIKRVTDPQSGLKKLVVFSGGNFTSGAVIIREQKHIYGIIMKCRIGLLQGSQTQYAIGDVEWRKTYNDRHITEGTKTISIDRKPYRINNKYLLIIGIVLIGLIITLKVLEFFGII